MEETYEYTETVENTDEYSDGGDGLAGLLIAGAVAGIAALGAAAFCGGKKLYNKIKSRKKDKLSGADAIAEVECEVVEVEEVEE